MTEYKIRLIIASAAFIVGVGVGYIAAKKDGQHLTHLQVLSVMMFFGYLIISGTFEFIPYSDLVAITILAIVSGEPIGKLIAKTKRGKK